MSRFRELCFTGLFFFVLGLASSQLWLLLWKTDNVLSIYYVSQEELLEIERQRVQEEGSDLFYGKTSEIFEYMEDIVEDYEKGGKYIVLR